MNDACGTEAAANAKRNGQNSPGSATGHGVATQVLASVCLHEADPAKRVRENVHEMGGPSVPPRQVVNRHLPECLQ